MPEQVEDALLAVASSDVCQGTGATMVRGIFHDLVFFFCFLGTLLSNKKSSVFPIAMSLQGVITERLCDELPS